MPIVWKPKALRIQQEIADEEDKIRKLWQPPAEFEPLEEWGTEEEPPPPPEEPPGEYQQLEGWGEEPPIAPPVEKPKQDAHQWLAEKLKELQSMPWETRLVEIRKQAGLAGIELPEQYQKQAPKKLGPIEKWEEIGEKVIEHPVTQALSLLSGLVVLTYAGYTAWQMFGYRISQPIANMFGGQRYHKTPEYRALVDMAKQIKKPMTDKTIKILDTELRRAFNFQKAGKVDKANEIVERIRFTFSKFKPGVAPGKEIVPYTAPTKPPVTPPIKPPTVPKVKPPAVAKPPIEAPLSEVQRTQLVDLAKRKVFITEGGQLKPQLRRLIIAQTGQRGTAKTTKALLADMTEGQADVVIEALRRLPEPTIKGRKKIPPRIPITTKLVPENFFNLHFGEPTPIKMLTSQTYYAQTLGVKPLVEPLELAKQRFDLEYRALGRTIDGMISKVNSAWRISLAERAKAKVGNVPTRGVRELRDLLDTYEDLPTDLVDKLSEEQVRLFSWFRNLSRTMLNGQNEVRGLLDLEAIPHRKAYVRHVADSMAQEIMLGNHPIPPTLDYWSRRIVGKRIFNPMEMQRRLADDLAGYFTKDLAYATKSMIYTGLKEIHLSQPLQALSEQMGAFARDLPQYKDLPAVEFERMRQLSVLPASTKRWVVDYVNQVIKGQQTLLDEQINRLVTQGGFAGLLNKALKPFGRTLGAKPVTQLTQIAGRMMMMSVMALPRPALARLMIRNVFQHTQDLALYSITALLKAYLPATGKLRELLGKSLFLRGYTGFEELPVDLQGKLERIGMKPYGATATFNAKTGMKTAYWDKLPYFEKSYLQKFDWADPQRTYTEPRGFLYPSEEELMSREMDWGAGATQYGYIGLAMPEIFRHKTLIPFTRLQSWWMNHFFRFHREAMYRFLKGKATYADDFARKYGRTPKLRWRDRLNYLQYLLLGGALLTGMGYTASYLSGVLPHNVTPVGQFMLGIYGYVSAKTDRDRLEAKRSILNSWRAIIPGALAEKEFNEIMSGERPLWSIFFYGKPEEGPPPRPPTWGIPGLEEKEKTKETKGWPKFPLK